MVGTLYVVATPIGNLEDMTLRGLRLLREVTVIAAEDTRTTRKLLSFYDTHTKLISYNEHNRKTRIPQLLALLESTNVALVSDAGTPTISDPGRELVQAAAERGIRVSPVPGPSVVTAALAVTGLPTDQYTFLGFLPRRSQERLRLLEALGSSPWTLVAFEVPHRLSATLGDALAVLGDRDVVACRELTKIHEEVFRGNLSEALEHFTTPRGEFTLVISGRPSVELATNVSDEALLDAVTYLTQQGTSPSEAASRVARQHDVPRRRVYQLSLGRRQ